MHPSKQSIYSTKAVYAGVDVGGTNVKFGIVSNEGQTLYTSEVKTRDLRKSGDFVVSFVAWLEHELSGWAEVPGIGVGLPAILNRQRTHVIECPNLSEIEGSRLFEQLCRSFPRAVIRMENDANCAAIGMHRFLRNCSGDTFIAITMGTGIGSAMFIDGELFMGGRGNAMEMGMMSRDGKNTMDLSLGKEGMLRYISDRCSVYSDVVVSPSEWDPFLVQTYAESGSPQVLDALYELGRELGFAIANTVVLMDATTVLVGGGLSACFEYMRNGVFDILNTALSPYYLNDLSVIFCSLGNQAGILGSASMVMPSVHLSSVATPKNDSFEVL